MTYSNTAKPSRNIIILLASFAQLIQQLIANMAVVALPDIAIELNFSTETILWVNIIYLLGLVAVCIPLSKLISRYGVKRFTTASIFSLIFSVILIYFSNSIWMLLLARLIQGLVSACLSVSIYIMVVNELEDHNLGYALGIVGSAGYLGMLLAPSFMGIIMYISNWRVAFLSFLPILVILLVLLFRIEKEWKDEVKKPIDYSGSVLYILSMSLLVYGITVLDDYGIITIIISIIILYAFVKVEKTKKYPVYNLNLFKNKEYIISNYAAMVTYFTTTIATVAVTFHLGYVYNFEAHYIGLILVIPPLVMIITAIFAGKLADKYHPKHISSIALVFITISMIIYFLVDFISLGILLIGCFFQGLGNGLFSAPNNKYVLTLVDEENLPDASSLLSTSKEFGKILSSSIYALIFSIMLGSNSLGPDELDINLIMSTELMMFINIIVCVSAIILFNLHLFKPLKDRFSNRR